MNSFREQMHQMIESYQIITSYYQPPPPCGPKIIIRPLHEDLQDIINKYKIIVEIPPITNNLNINAPEWTPPIKTQLPSSLPESIILKICNIFKHLGHPEYINIFKLMNMLNIPFTECGNFIKYLNNTNYFYPISNHNMFIKIKI